VSSATTEGDEGTPPESDVPAASARPGSLPLYLSAFVLLVLSFAALVLGGLALVGSGLSDSPGGFVWASIVLSAAALGLGVASVLGRRRP
jgi:hypothetical protein